MLQILPALSAYLASIYIMEGAHAADCDKKREYEEGSISRPPSDNLTDSIKNDWNDIKSGRITPKYIADRTIGLFKLATNGWKNQLTGTTPEGAYYNSCGRYSCYAGYRGTDSIEASVESGFIFHNGRLLTEIK